MSKQGDIEWTLDLGGTAGEVDVLVSYSWSAGSPGCSPSFSYPGDPPEPSEIEISSITLLNSEEDFPRELTSEEEQELYERIDEREYEDAGPDPDDWRERD